MVVRQALDRDHRVLYADFEDRPEAFADRARILGGQPLINTLTDPERFRYAEGWRLEEDGNRPDAAEWLDGGLLIIDAATSAGCPANGDDVREWITRQIVPFTIDKPSTAIVLDHIPKRSAGRPAGPVGSFYKLAAVNGAALRIVGQPWNRTENGQIALMVEKDRLGCLPAITGETAAVVRGAWENGAFGYQISPPTTSQDQDNDMNLYEAIFDLLIEHPEGLNTRGVLTGLKGKVKASTKRITDSLKRLAEDGLINRDIKGRSVVYRPNVEDL